MIWTIEYTDSARKELKKLDKQVAKRIVDFMDNIIGKSDNPRMQGKALKGELGDLWRYRVGDYRVITSINDSAVRILVIKTGNRASVYK